MFHNCIIRHDRHFAKTSGKFAVFFKKLQQFFIKNDQLTCFINNFHLIHLKMWEEPTILKLKLFQRLDDEFSS